VEESLEFVDIVLWGTGLREDGIDDEAAGSALEDQFLF
jgi:hypothetical protein